MANIDKKFQDNKLKESNYMRLKLHSDDLNFRE